MKKVFNLLTLILLSVSLFSCKSEKIVKSEFNASELKQFAQLATLECSFNNVATFNKPGAILWIDTTRTIFVEYEGVVKLGVNLDNIYYDAETKSLHIPQAEVLSAYDDVNSYKYYDSESGRIINQLDDKDLKKGIEESLQEMKTTLGQNNVMLRKAQGLARAQLEELVDSLYTIDGKKPDINYILE